MAGLKPEFDKRNTKIVGLSVDPVTNHSKWAKDIRALGRHEAERRGIERGIAWT